jgi:exonuclease SbcC
MEILSVTLKNFKGHSNRHFTFQPGTNAICGENGAGKTSILEAIAWTLFNYRGLYKNEDLVRNGAPSAQVRVEFVSNRDFRTYAVSRCTRAGYTIFDSQLGEKLEYTRIEDEVLPWLRQQLGVAPGTDLADLFANTIGVPQGMFTADFLKPERERKKTFDSILKVEEYRKLHDDLLPLSKLAESTVANLTADIVRYDEELTELEPLLERRQAHVQEMEQVQLELVQLQADLEQLQVEQEQLAAQAAELQQLEAELERLQELAQIQQATLNRAAMDLQQAEAAAAICTQNREAYQTFTQAEASLNQLQQQLQIEQQLQQKQRHYEKQLSDRLTQQATLVHQLEKLAEAEQEIQRLTPLLQQQTVLEQEQQLLLQQLQTCTSQHQAVTLQTKQISRLQSELDTVNREIHRIRQLESAIQKIPALEQQQQRLQQQLSRVAAATQFEADLRKIWAQSQEGGDRYLTALRTAETTLQDLQQAMPLWAKALEEVKQTLHIGSGWQAQLTTALQAILNDLTEQTSEVKLADQLHQVQSQLVTAREQQAQFANLERLLTQLADLERDHTEQQNQLLELKAQLDIEPSLKARQADLIAAMKELDDPRGRTHLLRRELQQQPKAQEKLAAVQADLAEVQQTIAQLDDQLAAFADLPQQMQYQQALKQQHQKAYQEYLAYRELANTRKERQKQLEDATNQLQTLEQQKEAITGKRDRLRQSFDPQQFQSVQAVYQDTHTRHISLSARLPDMQKYLKDLDQQVSRLHTIQTKRASAQTQLEQKRKVEKFIKFARKVYKDAGPRITERYLSRISQEADRLFRELLNRPNVGLEWQRDYEIYVQEGAHSRRFVNLSGGEQMCAALAVRLALLRVLADIDVAFFDEPTTNMDRPRRESLAEAIANIKTFRQLFVISHDDTFEKVTENVILVERETG